MQSLFLVLLPSLALAGFQKELGLGTEQSAAVTGNLLCFGQPASDLRVKLVDVDWNSPDDVMDEGFSDKKGHFELAGSETELGTIDATLQIFHKCNYNLICFYRVDIVIPKDYIAEGERANRTFDVGTLNLEQKYNGQGGACFP